MDSIVPAVYATGAEFVKYGQKILVSVTSRLLDSLMKSLRAMRGVRLWISLDTDTPDHKMPISRPIASALMRRRSLQLLSRLRRFRNSTGFRAVWTFNSNSRMSQPTHQPEILEFQRLLPYRITIKVGKSSQIVLSSHQQLLIPLQREAARNATAVRREQIASRACRSANCLKSGDQPPCATKGARNPCVRDCETLSGSPRASQCQCSFGSNVVAQLHVNLGHPSNDALARTVRLSGGSVRAIQAAPMV